MISAIFLPLILLVAAGDGVLDAMRDVVAENFLLGAAQRRPDRRDLRHDVDAVAVFLDHAARGPGPGPRCGSAVSARRSSFRFACLTHTHMGYICQCASDTPAGSTSSAPRMTCKTLLIRISATIASRNAGASTRRRPDAGSATRSPRTRCAAWTSIRTLPSTAPNTPAAPTISARAGCREKFVADPAKYLDGAKPGRSPCRKGRSTPARCIRRSGRSGPARARSAAWRSSR